jgi:hypothetical protein
MLALTLPGGDPVFCLASVEDIVLLVLKSVDL